MNNKRVRGAAFGCLILDVLAFIVATVLLFSTSNMAVSLVIAMLLYIFAWDAYRATEFLVKSYINK